MNIVFICGFQLQDARNSVTMLSLWLLADSLYWLKDINEDLTSTFLARILQQLNGLHLQVSVYCTPICVRVYLMHQLL